MPIEDVALVISATPDLGLTGAALEKMAERRIPFLLCDRRYHPTGVFLPYYQVTDSDLLKAQFAWTDRFRESVWRKIIVAKIRNQAGALPAAHEMKQRLMRYVGAPHRESTATMESTAARWYWSAFFPLLGGVERTRLPRTEAGLNGMLDYGYAVVRTAVLRSLAGRGFLTAVGLAHTIKPGAHPLADDLVEPLRAFIDHRLLQFIAQGGRTDDFKSWAREASSVLTEKIRMGKYGIRLLYAIDRYVESLGEATTCRDAEKIRIPML